MARNPRDAITPDLQDYYDVTDLPPPHRLSSISHSNLDIPLVQPHQGPYVSVRAMDPETERIHYSPPSNVWLEKEQARKKRSKMVVIGCVVALVGVIIVAVVAGVLLSKNKNGSSSSATNSGASSGDSSGDSPPVPQKDPNDPSSFVKDPRLKR